MMRSLLWFFIITLFYSCTTTQSSVEIQQTNNKDISPTFSNYWQQHVDYTMQIDMDVDTHQYKGQQRLVYTNNSPDELHKVFYHLYFNAFQQDSEMDARLHSIKDPDRRMATNVGTREKPIFESKIAKLNSDEMGFIKVHALNQNKIPVSYKVEGTILEVDLNQPIKPGEKVTFDMNFTAQVPLQIRRSGRNNKEKVALSMTQWYPKMAEYDFEGWHADPYIGREFFGVWGDYDVRIRIDKNYMLGGTGYVQNPQEVGFGYENPNKSLSIPSSDKLEWHFKAPNIHDFTWVADMDFAHDTKKLSNGVIMHFLYKDNVKTQQAWREMQPKAVEIMESYNNYIGQYPYKQYSIIQGGDGGMEYGMCTLITGNRSSESLLGIIKHEMAHAWFQFALATNESKHAWMDEGFASFVDAITSDKTKTYTESFLFKNQYDYYYYMVSTGQEEPLTTHADRYATNMSYGINAYDKGFVFIAQLAYIVGWENLEKSIKEYYKQWSGKHPSPNDFIRVVGKVSGMELGWYLNEFAQTTHTIDYAIKEVSGQRITLERIGEIPMPIDLVVHYTDGTKELFYIPLNLMRGEKPNTATQLPDWDWGHSTYSFNVKKMVKKVQIDTSQLMADINKKNNHFNN